MADFLQLSEDTAIRISDIYRVSVNETSFIFSMDMENIIVHTSDDELALEEVLLLLETAKEAPGISVTWEKAWDLLDDKMDSLSEDEVTAIFSAMGFEFDDDSTEDKGQ